MQASSQRCTCRSGALWRKVSRKLRRGQTRLSVIYFPFLYLPYVFIWNHLFHLWHSLLFILLTVRNLFIQIMFYHSVPPICLSPISLQSLQRGNSFSVRERQMLSPRPLTCNRLSVFKSESITIARCSHLAAQPRGNSGVQEVMHQNCILSVHEPPLIFPFTSFFSFVFSISVFLFITASGRSLQMGSAVFRVKNVFRVCLASASHRRLMTEQ